ncbi:MAG: hypothetical protein ACI4U5_05280 [Bacilli bacterium]
MKKAFSHSKYGNITYSETFWLGKKSISVKGRQLNKIDKVTFSGKLNGPEAEDAYVTIKGNILKGVKLNIDNEEIEIYPKLKPYEIIMALIPFILILIWGNSYALCSLLPVVGGMIGGGISGLFSALMVVFLRKVDKLYLKIIICVVITLITFLICFLVGLGIVSSMQSAS